MEITERASERTVVKRNQDEQPETSKATKRKPLVLDEDTYTDALSYIIERDFFPDLTKLKAQHEYLDAIESSDPERINRAHHQLTEIARTGKTPRLKTPAPTPKILSETPIQGFDTPCTPSFQESEEEVSNETSNLDKLDLNMSLSAFQAKYTSEDNASFSELMEKAEAKRRERYKWMFDKETGQLLLEDKPKVSEDHLLTEAPKNAQIDTWKYKVKNSLMYNPEGVGSVLENSEIRGDPKAILYRNTRLETNDNLTNTSSMLPPSMVNAAQGIRTPYPLAAPSPDVAGYNLVSATPALSPSDLGGMTPLMTWGTVEGSPLLISGGETPGQQFKLPPQSRRDLIAAKLSDRASKSIRKRAQSRTPAPIPSTPRTLPSPSLRVANLSSAAQNLLKMTGRRPASPTAHTDRQLRASYRSPLVNNQSGSRSSLATPTPSRLRTSTTPRTSNPSSSSSENSSLTDNLLNL
ncbi:uncharacterized protein VTP21DRAFT_463 [Calcarisporiella thermophila]|uniref:uncharacterized protein n=1 Tax=Calcarisporiella thermophila TaxID=911321 RepID=UPI003743BCA6